MSWRIISFGVVSVTLTALLLIIPLLVLSDLRVSRERSSRIEELRLLSGAAGIHQGHKHPPALFTDQHTAGASDLQGSA